MARERLAVDAFFMVALMLCDYYLETIISIEIPNKNDFNKDIRDTQNVPVYFGFFL